MPASRQIVGLRCLDILPESDTMMLVWCRYSGRLLPRAVSVLLKVVNGPESRDPGRRWDHASGILEQVNNGGKWVFGAPVSASPGGWRRRRIHLIVDRNCAATSSSVKMGIKSPALHIDKRLPSTRTPSEPVLAGTQRRWDRGSKPGLLREWVEVYGESNYRRRYWNSFGMKGPDLRESYGLLQSKAEHNRG
ncbi:hypothetical protein B0H19DRAFT_1057523 [Mycena capillaripes]|nr:hypothetical protein B0H19DRAFT_1057523 [Mycena capillaripes]